MGEMHAEFHVAVAAGGNVEVALYFVAFDGAKEAACILGAAEPWSLLELLLPAMCCA